MGLRSDVPTGRGIRSPLKISGSRLKPCRDDETAQGPSPTKQGAGGGVRKKYLKSACILSTMSAGISDHSG